MSGLENSSEYLRPQEQERIVEAEKGAERRVERPSSLDAETFLGDLRGHTGSEVTEEQQLQQLLEQEFVWETEDNLLIEEEFNPEEALRKIRKLPSSERRVAVTVFKEKLKRQQRAWAACRNHVRREIYSNPDASQEVLAGVVKKFADKWGFDAKRLELAEEIIADYVSNRKRIKKFREKYPDDRILVSKLVGVKIDESAELNVELSPVSIDIEADDATAGKLYKRSKKAKPLLDEEVEGFADESFHINPVYYTVRVMGRPCGILVHERQHREHAIVNPRFDTIEGGLRKRLLLWFNWARNPEEKQEAVETYFETERDWALIRAKSEIFAHKQEGRSLPYDFFEQNEEGYDYLHKVRNHKKKDPMWQEASQKILVEGYEAIVRMAEHAFDELARSRGFNVDKAINFLTDKRLQDWPKAITRQLHREGEKKPTALSEIAEAGHTYSISNSVRLEGLTSLRDGQKFSYTIAINTAKSTVEQANPKITVHSIFDEGLVVTFGRAPEIGEVLMPLSQAGFLSVTPE